jgi:rubrerythrin
MTAIYRFLMNEISVMGYTYKELMESRVMFRNRITVRLANYTFGSEIEAVQFYIEMNENISHSAADIKKARDYLATLIATDARASD